MSFLLATIACVTLALAIDRHWRQWFGDEPQTHGVRLWLRFWGVYCLALALVLHVEEEPVGSGLLSFLCEAMLGAGLVAFCCAMRARALTSDR